MKIALLGDMALIGRYDITTNQNVSERFATLAGILKECDYAIANLESPFTTANRTSVCKGVYLKSNPLNVNTLKELGITHVTLANNHTFDYGVKGAKETIDTLQNAGIEYVGLCNEPVLIEKGNDRVLLDGFCCYSANGVRYGTSEMHLNVLNEKAVLSLFSKAKARNALPVVSAHFGIEGLYHPSVEHREFFRMLAKNTDYILHGNHPHRIQGIEKYMNSYLCYSCGDLCFDDATETSINTVAVQDEESRQCYIIIATIEGTTCINTEYIALSDLPNGIIKKNDKVFSLLTQISEELSGNDEEIDFKRKKTCKELTANSTKRDFRFYFNRINFKYIGAYINGKIHARKYNKKFLKYFYRK